jgi:hypothetical protein
MKNLDDIGPNGKKIKTWLPDALHFQRGVQNLRVRDLEIEFPLQLKPTSEGNGSANGHINGTTNSPQLGKTSSQQIDTLLIQRAWWDAILQCYAHTKTSPQRMPLEMRITAGSEVTLAPQRGHTLGTCSIEILTLHSVADLWPAYAQSILDKWTSYRDNDDKLVVARPHWAKEWYGYTVRGRRWEEILRDEKNENGGFKGEIEEWRQLVGRLGARDGWTAGEARRRFGNDMLDWMFWGVERSETPESLVKNEMGEKKQGKATRFFESCFK